MRVGHSNLSYCMNVHPAATLEDVINNLQSYTVKVAANVSAGKPFGVGLWLPASAIKELKEDITPLKQCLEDNKLYLFTINGFPYGPFHGQQVKTKVYQPDWSDERRLKYTCDLLDIMAELLPSDIQGSISTVPITYGKQMEDSALDMLAKAADHARQIHQKTGKKIFIALEPEPDCYLEDTPESITFFERFRKHTADIDDYIGLCFDTCHIALQNENLEESYDRLQAAGINIAKIQVSAALVCDNHNQQSAIDYLSSYDEEVYLHQTRIIVDQKTIKRYADLGPALSDNPAGTWLVHFHVPLHFQSNGPLSSTAIGLTTKIINKMLNSCPNIEIETYTFNVNPDEKGSIVDSISDEFNWLTSRF